MFAWPTRALVHVQPPLVRASSFQSLQMYKKTGCKKSGAGRFDLGRTFLSGHPS